VTAIFALCVRLFPRVFREEFGADLVAQALSDYHRALEHGTLAGLWVGCRSAANLVGAAVAEHFRPTWNTTVVPAHQGSRMRTHLDQWRLDVTHALRALRRSPGFALVAVFTLALAIGVTAAIFSVVNTVLIRPFPYGETDRLVFLAGTAPGSDLPPEFGLSTEFYVHYRDRAQTLAGISTVQSFTNTLRVGDRVERIRMSAATYTLFSTLGASPVLGALPGAADADTSAVISHTLWQSWFGGREDVIGQSHFMGGGTRTIVGVMGPDFRFPTDGTLLWITTDIRESSVQLGRLGIGMVARMKPGVAMDQTATELTDLARELPERFGGSPAYARTMAQMNAIVRPMTEQMLGGASQPLWVLFGATGIVLLIACANVANLLMVRAEGRHREMAVRRAIGAQRGQLLRVQLSEVMLVALAAGVVAILFARLALPLFLQMAPEGIPRLADAGVDAATIVFTGVLAVVVGLVCGIVPALRASRPSFAKLRDGSRGTTRGRAWVRSALVAGQTALALVLLIGAGLLLRSYDKLSRVDPGYDVRDVFTFQIAPQQPQLVDGPSYTQFILSFMDRLRALPGVELVGLVENVPLDEGAAAARFITDAAPGDGSVLLNATFAGGDYYKAMGIPVLAGRAFEAADATTALGNVVVSRSAARMLWPDQDPIGRRLQRVGLTTWETVVGVVEDVVQNDFRQPGLPMVYLPIQGQQPTQWALSSPGYVIKTARADAIAADVRDIVRQVAPEAPMYRVYTMQDLADRALLGLSFTMMTLGTVSVLALILGAVGLYGVLSYVVSERTREIGVRLALGAQTGAVRRMVVVQGAKVIGAGIALGLLVAVVSTRALGSMLYGVQADDVVTFVGTAFAMVLIGLGASYLPARRASNVDPMESLRGD
jgi:predicted permease